MTGTAALGPIVLLMAASPAFAQGPPAEADVEDRALADWASQAFGDAGRGPGRTAGLPAGFAVQAPFSFRCGGRFSRDFLSTWKRGEDDLRWADPQTGLEVRVELRCLSGHPAVEWLVRLRNGGTADTPILEDILALDLEVTLPDDGDAELHRACGSTSAETDFLPIRTPVGRDADIAFAPQGGRSSDGALPFFNLQWPGGGVIAGIGWSGQWAARIRRDGGRTVRLEAGQQLTRLVLRPGEEIRTPRMLLVCWRGLIRRLYSWGLRLRPGTFVDHVGLSLTTAGFR